MKAASSISLVILLLLNLFGFYFSYYIKVEGIHEEMEETLRSSSANLQVISLSLAEYRQLQWTSPGKECRIKGNMYDVLRTETSASAVKLYVRMDVDETTLDNDFAQNFQSKQELPNTPAKLFSNMIGQDFIVEKYKIIVAPVFTSAIFQSHPFNSALAEFVMEKISPPPWC